MFLLKFKYILIALSCFSVFIRAVAAIPGRDYLGGVKFQDVILQTHPEGWAVGIFSNTFGDAFPFIDKLLATKNIPVIRIYLLWRDDHEYGDRDIPVIKKEARRWQKLAKKYPNVRFEISPFCEHNLTNPDKYLDIVAKASPSSRPVNTVWKGALSSKYKNEIHGSSSFVPKGDYNFSFDGEEMLDLNIDAVKEKFKSAEIFFLWHPNDNGRIKLHDNMPIKERSSYTDLDLNNRIIEFSKYK
jgi:hypothetical protein